MNIFSYGRYARIWCEFTYPVSVAGELLNACFFNKKNKKKILFV